MSQGPYKVGTMAKLTGLSPAVLRAWERRYGLLHPERGPGGQRLYTDQDLLVLRRVRQLLDEGRSIGEAVRVVGETDPGSGFLGSGVQGSRVPGSGFAGSRLPGAGFAGSQMPAAALRQPIVDAALALDSAALSASLDAAFAELGAERAVHDVIEPCAHTLGDLWAAGECSVASEHLASDLFTHRVRRLLDAAQPAGRAGLRAVAACFPDEQHHLGLLMLSWRLARRGLHIDYLGPSMPLEEIERACRDPTIRSVLLSVTRPATWRRHHDAFVAALRRGTFPRPIYVGGQGVPADDAALVRSGALLFGPASGLDGAISRIAAG